MLPLMYFWQMFSKRGIEMSLGRKLGAKEAAFQLPGEFIFNYLFLHIMSSLRL
jgi:hypothetical protein